MIDILYFLTFKIIAALFDIRSAGDIGELDSLFVYKLFTMIKKDLYYKKSSTEIIAGIIM